MKQKEENNSNYNKCTKPVIKSIKECKKSKNSQIMLLVMLIIVEMTQEELQEVLIHHQWWCIIINLCRITTNKIKKVIVDLAQVRWWIWVNHN
jgi:hypothetical protein